MNDQPELKPPFAGLRSWLTADLVDEIRWRIEHGEIPYNHTNLQALLRKTEEQRILEDNFCR